MDNIGDSPLLIKGGRIVDPSQGLDGYLDLLLDEGRVSWLGSGPPPAVPRGCFSVDASNLIIFPGFIDLHAHLREPGEEHKETIATGTFAAARGGFTTLCCMPNTVPPLDTPSSLAWIRHRAEETGVVRVLPIGCVSRGRLGEHRTDFAEMRDAGAIGFSDDGNPVSSSSLMRAALTASADLDLPIIQHAEDIGLTAGGVMHEGLVSLRLGLTGASSASEESCVARDLALAKVTGGWLHVAHVSTAGAVEQIRIGKEQGIRVTAEVTPHHLLLTDEWVQGGEAASGAVGLDGYRTDARVNPPLRTNQDNQVLLSALQEGIIDCIATDHAPHAKEDKLCLYSEAAPGISGLETALSVLLGLVRQDKLRLTTLIAGLTNRPAHLLPGPFRNLGTLTPGSLADIALVDLDRRWTVDPSKFASKGQNTPWRGDQLTGQVIATLVSGRFVHGQDAVKYDFLSSG